MPNTAYEDRRAGNLAGFALLLLAVGAIVFVGLCLILEEVQSNLPVPSVGVDVTRTGAPVVTGEIFLSRPALIVYCTILAGVLGTSVRILADRLSANAAVSSGAGSVAVASRIFLGGAFAFAAGFLVPHALASGTIAASYNVWSLMIIGGIAGYASSLVTGGVQEGLEGLMVGLRRGVAEAIVKEEMTKTLAESAREVLTLPEPVAFVGIVEVDVTDEMDVSAVKEVPSISVDSAPAPSTEGRGVYLNPGTTYRVWVRLVPQGANLKPRSTWPIAVPIDIEGTSGTVAPLDVRVDYGFLSVPAARYQSDVSTASETALPAFVFSVPPSTVVASAEHSGVSDEIATPRRLTVSVLQNKIPYLRKQITIEMPGDPQPAAASQTSA